MDSSVIYIGSGLSLSIGDIIGEGTITVSPESESYVENMEVSIQARGSFPYGFKEWTDSLSGSVNPAIITLDSDMVVGAIFDTDSSSSLYINFQPESSPVPGGYLPDYGKQFASRGNGYSYGWLDGDNNEQRNRSGEADMRKATLNHMVKGDTATWEIELQDGNYAVYVHLGDADYSDQNNSLRVEGIEWLDSDGEDNFDDFYMEDVPVSDGRMTLKPIGNPKINFIKIGFKGKTFGNYLAVNGGSGSGEYKEDEVVNISAESGSGYVFESWTGDTSHVADAFALNTSLVMPAKDIALASVFNPANKYALTVNGGTGGGDFAQRDIVVIRAEAAPEGKLFDQWTGDTEYVTFVNEP